MGKNRNLIKTAALHLGVLLLMALGALNMKIGLAPTAFFFTLLAASAFSAVLILNGKKLNYLVTVPVFAAAYFISGNIFFAVFSFSGYGSPSKVPPVSIATIGFLWANAFFTSCEQSTYLFIITTPLRIMLYFSTIFCIINKNITIFGCIGYT